MRLRQIWLPIILLVLSSARLDAATRFAAPADLLAGDCSSTGNACDLQQALTGASCGDTIEAGNGTYTGDYTAAGTNCTSGNKLTIRATNLHQAILDGDTTCPYTTNKGIEIERQWVIFERFAVKEHCIAVTSNSQNVEIRHNMITDFNRFGVWANNSSLNIHHNVIARGWGANIDNFDWMGIGVSAGLSNLTVTANWIYSSGSRQHYYAGGVGAQGSGIEVSGPHTNSTFKGNVFMDHMKATAIRLFGDSSPACIANPGPACPQSTGNLIRDNIMAYGQGGGFGITENASSNTVTNNFIYGGGQTAGIGSKGNDPGFNVYTHNTIIATAESFSGFGSSCGSEVGNVCDEQKTLKDNVLFAPETGRSQLIFLTEGSGSDFLANDYNLVWRAGPTSGWVTGYTYGANDIHATGARPVFQNEAAGDYRLATGSPGKGSASDATDRGAIFDNTDGGLRVDWMQAVVQFQTTENTVSGTTSTSFTGLSTAHEYQVWAYVDNSSPYTGNETFTVEGVSQGFNMGSIIADWLGPATQRYIYLTTRITDGTMNVSWTNANTLDKVKIRKMPTPAEAYTLLAAAPGGDTTPPTPPTGLTVTSVASHQQILNWSASSSGDVTGYDVWRCSGAACPPTFFISLGNVLTYTSTGLTANTLYRYQVRARDAVPNLSTLSSIDEEFTDAVGLVLSLAFDEASGTAADASGYSQSCTMVDNAARAAGRVGANALLLDGVNDACQVTGTPRLQPPSVFAVSLWFKGTVTDSSGSDVFNAGDSVALRVLPSGEVGCAKYSGAFVWEGHDTVGANVLNGVWRHLFCQYTGTAMEIRIDDVSQGSTAVTGAVVWGLSPNLQVGRHNTDTTYDTNGTIDQLKFYDTTRSAGQVTALFNEGGGDITPPSAPTGLTLTVISRSRIDLNWTASISGDVTTYRVEWCAGAACTPVTQIALGNVLTYSHTSLLAGTRYHYQVRALDAALNVSGPSTPVQQALTLTCGPA